jgi:hypothetical protein
MQSGQSVAVGVDKSASRPGYVKFDGVNMAKRELTEVKGFGYKVNKDGKWDKGYVSRRMQEKIVHQSNRQLGAAKKAGMSLRWVVPSEAMRKAFGEILGKNVKIEVVSPNKDVEDVL